MKWLMSATRVKNADWRQRARSSYYSLGYRHVSTGKIVQISDNSLLLRTVLWSLNIPVNQTNVENTLGTR